MSRLPKLLVTGFGPFPGAPENPTKRLVEWMSRMPPDTFGEVEVEALILPTEYQGSWAMLDSIYKTYVPDIVIHFGLSVRHKTIRLESLGHNVVSPRKPDAAGYSPSSRRIADVGPKLLPVTLPILVLESALSANGFRYTTSSDAGEYVCNATLYRSLFAARLVARRWVGLIHVPPEGAGMFTRERLEAAAVTIVNEVVAAWSR